MNRGLRNKMLPRRQSTALQVFALLALVTAASAFALVGGVNTDSPTADSTSSGAGSPGAGGVLTAAPVAGKRPAEGAFVPNAGGNRAHTFAMQSIAVPSGYRGAVLGADGVWRHDLAVLTLAEPAPERVPVYPLHKDAFAPRTALTMIGYGTFKNGPTAPASPGVKRMPPLLFFFDPPAFLPGHGPEAASPAGNSGAPPFVVYPGGFDPSNFFPGSVISGHAGWGDDGAMAPPVPEPATYALMLVGLGLLGVAVHRHNRNRVV